MLEVHFDTMTAVSRMREGGFNKKQAETMTVVLRDAISSGVATKTDVAELKGEIEVVRGEIATLRADMTGKLKSMQTNIRWIMVIGGFIAIAVAEPLVTRLFSWIS